MLTTGGSGSADGHLALVRADDRKVLCEGRETSLSAVAEGLRHDGAFADAGDGAATTAARRGCSSPRPRSCCTGRASGTEGKKKVEVPGPPLPLRLVVTEVRDLEGRVLARWLLLTNVPAELADAATIARWYYFRWRIESLHKLLKKAGWQLEGWLQRNGERLLIKLLLGPRCVHLDLGPGAAARRGVGGVQAVADAAERPADEAGPSDHDQRPAGRAVGARKARWARWLAMAPSSSTPCWRDHLPLFATKK